MFANIKIVCIFDLSITKKLKIMTNFVTVIQTQANKFDVFFFNAEASTRLYPQTSKQGICVHIAEATKESEKYCFQLAENMNNEAR